MDFEFITSYKKYDDGSGAKGKKGFDELCKAIREFTPDQVRQILDQWQTERFIFEELAVRNAFSSNKDDCYAKPENFRESVYAKVIMLQRFYSTGLVYAEIPFMVDKIERLSEEEQLQELIDDPGDDLKAVDLIAKKNPDHPNEPQNDLLAFASKYCSFSNAEKFPISDSYIRDMVYRMYKGEKFQNERVCKNAISSIDGYKRLAEILRSLHYIVDPVEYEFRGEIVPNCKKLDKLLWTTYVIYDEGGAN